MKAENEKIEGKDDFSQTKNSFLDDQTQATITATMKKTSQKNKTLLNTNSSILAIPSGSEDNPNKSIPKK